MKSTNKDKIFRSTTIYKEILKLANRDTFLDINESAVNSIDIVKIKIRNSNKNRKKLLLSKIVPVKIEYKIDISKYFEIMNFKSGYQSNLKDDVFLYFNQYTGNTYLSNEFNYRFDKLQEEGIPILNLSQELKNDIDLEVIPENLNFYCIVKGKLFDSENLKIDVKVNFDEFGAFLNQYIKNKLIEKLPTFAYDPSKYFDECVGKYNFPFLGIKTITDEEFRSFWTQEDLVSLSKENIFTCYRSVREKLIPKLIEEHYSLLRSLNDEDNTFLAKGRFTPLKFYDSRMVLEKYYETDTKVFNIIDDFNIYYLSLFANNPKLLSRIEPGRELQSFQVIMSYLVKVENSIFQLNDDLIKVLPSSSKTVCDLRRLFDYISETKTDLNNIKLDTKINIFIESYNSDKSENENKLLELLKTPNSKIPDIIKNNIRIVYKDYNNKIFIPRFDRDSILVLKELTEKYGIKTCLPPKLISELSEYLK
jgi:hypothetical protein